MIMILMRSQGHVTWSDPKLLGVKCL